VSSPFNVPPVVPTSQPGTSCICLGNYLPQATKFKICGIKAGHVQTVEVMVKAFSYQWSEDWETGPNKMVYVETNRFSKCFCPFVHPGNIALFR
jgi:hypothetical protein